MKLIQYLLIVVIASMLFGCQTEEPIVTDDTGYTEENVNHAVNANNRFAIELYKNLPTEGNTFFSPYSITSAMVIAYEGAREDTATEIQTVFDYAEENKRRPAFANIYNQLNAPDKGYKLHTANALWLQQDYLFFEKYVTTIEKYYGGSAQNLDFAGETEQSRLTINDWVESKTNNKIKDLFAPGTIMPLTRLVITNAVYFKADWVKQFKKSSTHDEPFYITPESKVTVDMMSRTKENEFNYAETEELQILEMNYKGEETSMVVLLPKEHNIKDIEDQLSVEQLDLWLADLEERKIPVYFPKFTFTTKYTLNDYLKAMGMEKAFDPAQSDFSGMTNYKELYISLVIHQAYIDVYEEGTEAAAATGIAMVGTSMPMNEFRANRPFMFFIMHKPTGMILFMGKVVDPSAE